MKKALIGFGFWHSLLDPTLPDPAWFIDEKWSEIERKRVLAYLAQGQAINHWMGYSWCRFRCSRKDVHMGSCDLTDGTFIWPEELAHYIERHSVRLPERIVQHILSQIDFPKNEAKKVSDGTAANNDWWLTQKGWRPDLTSFISGSDEEEIAYLRRFDRGSLAPDDFSEAAILAREKMVALLKEKHQGHK